MHKKNFSLRELADICACELIGDPHYVIHGVSDLETATAQDASFLANPRYRKIMLKSKAGVIFIDEQTACVEGINYLISRRPSIAFQKAIEAFHPQRKHPSGFQGIHPTAVIHETAQIEQDVTIAPYAVVDEYAKIGSCTFIGSGSYIGPYSTVGSHCLIYPHVVIREECHIGDRVVIQSGAIIGSCGFGFTTNEKGIHEKLTQVGNVVMEDDVEVGANTTIDRSRFKTTFIRVGSKLDNLIQVGHGAEIGAHNLIIAQTAIAGSTTTGKHVVLAGQVAVAGHLQLADGVMIAGKSAVTKSLPSGKYGGIPAVPLPDYNRNAVFQRNIETYVKEIKSLERRVSQLERTGNVQ
jgi:UDP-3-O-[3-hydroxymyristoyl] glucosamine N-acyltransferase